MAERIVTHGNVYDHFEEYDEVHSLIDALPSILKDFRALELALERMTNIVDKYQEQPHLLDPHLERIINKLFGIVKRRDAPSSLMHQAFKYLYLFSKLRGPKIIVRWFTHEVSDLDLVLALLQKQDRDDYLTWETRYMLLLWLSIIVLIPFDLSRMDPTPTRHARSTVDRIMAIGQVYLSSSDKSQDAAAHVCAKFLSRPDVQKLKLKEFLDWGQLVFREDNNYQKCGFLKTLATLFKIAKREDVLSIAPLVLELVTGYSLPDHNNTLLRKLHMKLIQRLGTTFLPSKVLSWRYQRGSRSLEETLSTVSMEAVAKDDGTKEEEEEEEEEDEFDIPEEVENILGELLTGLKDKDTVVRWSAAKGIGRLTGRLPKELANEVLDSLLECFSTIETDSTWHGGCLALAELGRRGLLLPERLDVVVPVILRALLYDERRGSCSVGSHVRDAACYVSWSLARAYNPEQLKPYVSDIASGLVLVMIFDREVNCRRAASAAFQENVGRQGIFPHGIDILTMADYFAVGSISHVYLDLSLKIGSFTEYTQCLINHLLEVKLPHWDHTIRELAAASLSVLTPLNPSYMMDESITLVSLSLSFYSLSLSVLPQVLSNVTSSDTSLRHGSLHAVAEVLYGLYKVAAESNQSIEEFLGAELTESVRGVASRAISRKVFKGSTGDIMRVAVLKYIERCCLSNLKISDAILEVWQSIINDNLPHTVESIREEAVKTFGVICECKYSKDQTRIRVVQSHLMPQYIFELDNKLHFARMGFSLALGAMPKEILEGKLLTVLKSLTRSASDIDGVPAIYCESRRDVIRAISNICNKVDISADGPPTHFLNRSLIELVFSTLFKTIGDYSTDRRGDIAAIVREATMSALESLCIRLTDTNPSLLKPHYVSETIGHLLQQGNEKIDRTRSIACNKLISLLQHHPPVPNIPHNDELHLLFLSEVIKDINWSVAQSSFPFTVQALGLNTYSYRVLLGLVISVGGLTESLVKSSSASLLHYLSDKSKDELEPFAVLILKIFDEHSRNPRVILPLLKTLDLLLTNASFHLFMSDTGEDSFPALLLDRVKLEVKGSRDPIIILNSICVFTGLLQFEVANKSSFSQLMLLLGHSFPKVRRITAERLYKALLMCGDSDLLPEDERGNEIFEILNETQWDGPLPDAREKRNRLCVLLDLPALKTKEGGSKTKTTNSESLGYKDLVDRMGY
ncbi:PREDICTED: tubulin-specific chaperone D-like isoform X2 [Amphimedon queenslandica]|uniref:Tubulin-specific chaperone D n=1 Tax=Amphimedon queenslandica TaxID=400682 RepID=A0AAN0J9L4_AMPQE|nr:PREDICTED: tubulin-specific chaperone D-like isoform X2 [Amphimedon queenslandica]|eukprot:XP_019853730.1 PREDICTED: tubulin-specific chaperone D-like isoform X2 [Amphimedon queenslandica]